MTSGLYMALRLAEDYRSGTGFLNINITDHTHTQRPTPRVLCCAARCARTCGHVGLDRSRLGCCLIEQILLCESSLTSALSFLSPWVD